LSCQYEIITPANTVSCSDGLQIDHIWPKSKNGHGGPANLAVLCNTHNTEKTSNVSQVNGDLLDKKDFYEPYIHICKEIYRKI
jgi:5-methylcytosine-specific restriction endonuclease McrA